ncbi:MAG: cytochrome c [Alphaproteobacteria bacterium]|nr:cytochrome c [Alphaproteobacteria bacterium]
MRVPVRLALLASVCLAPAAAHAQAPEFPAAAKSCITCHGRDGIGTSPGFPNLAGQKSIYMMEQLTLYRDGKRQSDVMNIAAAKLSGDDIRAIAEYYEAMPACKP